MFNWLDNLINAFKTKNIINRALRTLNGIEINGTVYPVRIKDSENYVFDTKDKQIIRLSKFDINMALIDYVDLKRLSPLKINDEQYRIKALNYYIERKYSICGCIKNDTRCVLILEKFI